jgi:hypothetical protein
VRNSRGSQARSCRLKVRSQSSIAVRFGHLQAPPRICPAAKSCNTHKAVLLPEKTVRLSPVPKHSRRRYSPSWCSFPFPTSASPQPQHKHSSPVPKQAQFPSPTQAQQFPSPTQARFPSPTQARFPSPTQAQVAVPSKVQFLSPHKSAGSQSSQKLSGRGKCGSPVPTREQFLAWHRI